MKLQIGQTLDRYQITKLLGQGGMGAVYRARDTKLKRDVALKVMHAHLAAQPAFTARFLQEAQAAANLDHPGIVKVFDFKESGDLLYIVMEFIPGGNLKQILQQKRKTERWLSLVETIDLVQQIALALAYAHHQGVLHRDIKPANLMLKPDLGNTQRYHPVITDMGLAKLAQSSVVTQIGEAMGTPAYMSPEQALGKPVGPATDIYALGVVFYELAVGRLPYQANTLSEAFQIHHKGAPPPAPRLLRPELPPTLETVIYKALANDPAQRFTTGRILADALVAPYQQILADAGMATVTEDAASLATLYEQSLLEQARPIPKEEEGQNNLSEPGKFAKLQMQDPNGNTRLIELKNSVMTVGRDTENSIALPEDLRASRHHARIEFDGVDYKVTDLNSRNGTFLGNNQLLPGVPERWAADKLLRIGDHRFQFQNQPAGAASPMGAPVLPDPAGMRPTPQTPLSPPSLRFTLQPLRKQSTQPGNFQLSVFNRGNGTVQLRLSAQEPTNECLFTFEPPQVTIGGGAESAINLQIHLRPNVSIAVDKMYHFEVTVTDPLNPRVTMQVQGEWTYVAKQSSPPRQEQQNHPEGDQGPLVPQSSRQLGWWFGLFWTLATLPVMLLNGVQLWFLRPNDQFSLGTFGILAVYSAVLGWLLGILQWLVLRRQMVGASRWILNSLVAWSVGFTVVGTLTLSNNFYFYAAALFKILLLSAIQGSIVAGIQWRILRHHSKGWLKWISATIAGLALGPLLMSNVYDYGGVGGVIFSAVVFGVITGTVLVRLMHQSVHPREEQR